MLEYIEHQRGALNNMAGDVMDITLYSEGALSYRDLMEMSPIEVRIAVTRLNKYMKEKAEAMKG